MSKKCLKECFDENSLGLSWEKLFFSWDFRGTFSNGFQEVTRKVGNFVGITFFFVGLSWEKVGKKVGGNGWEMDKVVKQPQQIKTKC